MSLTTFQKMKQYVKNCFPDLTDSQATSITNGIFEIVNEVKVEEIVCHNCGAVNDYHTEKSGPHIKAVCNGCDKYIKFITQHKKVEVEPEDRDAETNFDF